MHKTNPTPDTLAQLDQLGAAIAHAEAMSLAMGTEDFNQLADDVQSDYVWALQTKLREAREHFRAISNTVGG